MSIPKIATPPLANTPKFVIPEGSKALNTLNPIREAKKDLFKNHGMTQGEKLFMVMEDTYNLPTYELRLQAAGYEKTGVASNSNKNIFSNLASIIKKHKVASVAVAIASLLIATAIGVKKTVDNKESQN